MAIGPQSQHGLRQVRRKPVGDYLLLAMIKEPDCYDGNPDQRQCEGEQQGILEHDVGEMSEIQRDAECAEHRIGSPHQDHRDEQQADIEQAVDGSP